MRASTLHETRPETPTRIKNLIEFWQQSTIWPERRRSSNASSNTDLFEKTNENPPQNASKSSQSRSKIASQGVPGAFGGPSVAQERQKAPQEGAQATPRAPLGAHKGIPRGTKAAQRAPRGGQRARQRDLGRGKIDHKSTSEAKKVKFAKSAPRLGPADVPGTSPPPDRPQIGPKSPQVGPSSPNTALHGGHEGGPGRNVALCEGQEGGQSTKRRPVRKGPGHDLGLQPV